MGRVICGGGGGGGCCWEGLWKFNKGTLQLNVKNGDDVFSLLSDPPTTLTMMHYCEARQKAIQKQDLKLKDSNPPPRKWNGDNQEVVEQQKM